MMCSVFGSIQVFSLQQLDEIVPRVKIVMSVDSGHIIHYTYTLYMALSPRTSAPRTSVDVGTECLNEDTLTFGSVRS